MLDFATLQGARTNGLGSLTPGKQADLLVVNASDLNTMPLNDAVGTLVLGADPRNIETVLVAGVIRKSGGRLVGVDVAQLHEQVVASRDSILATAASSHRPGARQRLAGFEPSDRRRVQAARTVKGTSKCAIRYGPG